MIEIIIFQVKLCHQVLSAAEVETVDSNVLCDSLDVLRKLSRYKQAKEQNSDLMTRVTSNIVAQVSSEYKKFAECLFRINSLIVLCFLSIIIVV